MALSRSSSTPREAPSVKFNPNPHYYINDPDDLRPEIDDGT